MNFSVTVPQSLTSFLDCLNPAGRHSLFSVAANALKIAVVGHLRREVPRRHVSASRLGASPTMHLQKGAARVSWSADSRHGTVHLPIAGIGRALHDVTISARNAGALTLPVHRDAYGHRVDELRRMGWSVFRPKGKNVLMGKRKGDEEAVSLYALKKSVKQRQDRSLLPSDSEINGVVARAMVGEIRRVQRKVG